jgi:hypothetical protein
MTTIAADYFRRSAVSTQSSPPSSEVNVMIRNMLADARSAASQAASSLPARAFADLARVARECSTDGWDGCNARAITRATCGRAQAFLNDLPVWMPAPDIVPEADGEIAIEWYVADNQTFSVSIGQTGPLHYAGLFGQEDEAHGVKSFDGAAVPEEILQLICKLLRSSAARRAA